MRFATLAARGSIARHARLVELCEQGDVAAAAAVSRETWQTLDPRDGEDR